MIFEIEIMRNENATEKSNIVGNKCQEDTVTVYLLIKLNNFQWKVIIKISRIPCEKKRLEKK